jgi:DNA-binding NtrC family response regulator
MTQPEGRGGSYIGEFQVTAGWRGPPLTARAKRRDDFASMAPGLLLVDDYEGARQVYGNGLARAFPDLKVASVGSAPDAIDALRSGLFGVVISDILLGGHRGDDIFRACVEGGWPVRRVALTGQGIRTGDEAIAAGAEHVHYKDEPFEQLVRVVARMCPVETAPWGAGRLVGRSSCMRVLRERIRLISRSDATILVTGPSGSGKELVAQALHEEGRNGPFVAIACGALPPELVSSELFGNARGAFTGAHEARRGLLEEAGCGTVLLDDFDLLPLAKQAALLRVLETGEIVPVGSVRVVRLGARVVVAVNRDLKKLVELGLFRQDLYYRIEQLRIDLSSLGERPEDIDDLVPHFAAKIERARTMTWSPDALVEMGRRPWEGNVRELRNAVIRVTAEMPPEDVREVMEDDVRRILGPVESRPVCSDAPRAREVGRGPEWAAHLARQLIGRGGRFSENLRAVARAGVDITLEKNGDKVRAAGRELGEDHHFVQRHRTKKA